MTVEEYIQRLKHFSTELERQLPAFLATQGMNAKALIQHRIQTQGLNSADGSLGKYSKNPLPDFFFTGKGNKEAQKKLEKEFPDGISYEEWRTANGRQVDHIDLTFTRGGAGMFGSTSIIAQSYSGGIGKVSVGGKDETTKEKLSWNSQRYGDVLKLDKKEEALINQEFENWVMGIAKQTGIL